MCADRRIQTPEPLEAILSTALDAVVVMDSEGRVADWNEAAAQTFGWSRNQALGAVLSELIIPVQFRANHKQGLGGQEYRELAIRLGARAEKKRQPASSC